MADPVSLAASIIAFGQAANAASKIVHRVLDLKTAPQKLLDSTTRVLAKIAINTAESSSSITDQDANVRFERLASRAKDVLDEASAMIRSKLVKNQEEFGQRWHWDQDKKIEYRLIEFGDGRRRLSDEITAPMVEEADDTCEADSLSGSPVSGASLSNGAFGGPATQLAEPATLLLPNEVEVATPSTRQLTAPTSHLLESMASFFAQVQVEVTLTEDSHNICECSCHSPLAVRTPSWLVDAVGRLLIRWYRSPETCAKCSIRACKVARNRMLSTQYFFPWWMTQRRLIELESGWSTRQRLSISLRTTNIIPDDSTVFLFAEHNNIDGMKRLFEQKLASPYDVSLRGRTSLHFAATAVKAQMIEFLVKQKSQADVEDQDHLSPNDIIWELYLRNPEKRRFILDAAGLSPSNTESLEKQSFSGLHRIVLGLDLTGKTALAWAASRKDPQPVRTLLKHGASTSIADYRFKTTLHYYAGSGDPQSMQMILEAIKDRNESQADTRNTLIEAGDDKNRTPLNYASRMDLYPHTQLLIDYGANLEANESTTKRTILLNAVYWNSHKVLPLLLSHSAKTGVKDSRNETLLHHLARFGDLETLQIMAEHDLGHIDVKATNVLGLTALDVFNSSDARCSPEEKNDRRLAAGLFATVLRSAAQGIPNGKGSVVLEKVQEVDSDDESKHEKRDENEDKDVNEVYYDAVTEIEASE
ncbi:ankyrin repeat-containing domain protein [Lasiosphaeris hirsuta]|uniref:Ankyrin repeat-containing domain protein n=1 Tax=Lasiosphaeris hirsuta TaxID=260670 RepID=A0AA40DFM3_9PEZI|nr:ankyrin repeat-containing domain protein [Lasiosphaeris hirsuta]